LKNLVVDMHAPPLG